jgi:DNA-binding LacI/PurR family transcriptional regulator
MPAVRDLARKHRVATVSVNRALKLLAEERLVVAQPRHGYRVCPGAADPDRGLPLAYINSTHHLMGRGRDQFHRTLLMQFQLVASRRGWSLMAVDADSAAPGELLKQVLAADACGVITNTSEAGLWEELRRTGMPSVLVDAWNEEFDGDCVLQDGFRGGVQAGRHLVRQGHERIGWMGPSLQGGPMQILERFSGARSALAAAGRDFSCQVEAPLGNPEAALDAAKSLLGRADRPTAVLALWQDASQAVARAARELGLVIGRDFAMVGWCTEEEHEHDFRSWFPRGQVPAAVVWPIAQMAEVAVARLRQRRTEPHLAPLFLRVPTRLLPGDRDRA